MPTDQNLMCEIHWLNRLKKNLFMWLFQIFMAGGIFLAIFNVNLCGEIIVLKNGGDLKGGVIEESNDYVKVRVENVGELTLNRTDVRSIEKNGDFLTPPELYEKKKRELNEASPEAHLELGNFCVENRLYGYARNEFKRVVEIDPDYKEEVEARLEYIEAMENLNRAKYLLEMGDYVEVVRIIETLLSSKPQTIRVEEEAHELLSRANDKMGDILGKIPVPIGSESMSLDKAEDILKLLNSAQNRIDCFLVRLDNLQVFNSLVAAVLRGIDVRIVADKRHIESNILQIKSIGAKVKELDFEGRLSSLFFIIDGKCLWISPYGVGQASVILGKNNSIKITHTPLVQRYLRLFERLYNGTPGNDERRGEDFVIGQSMVESYFTPGEDAKARLLERIKAARESLYFWTAYFEDKDICNAIINLHRSGVMVKGVFERKPERRIDYNRMLKKGLNVGENDRTYSIYGTMIIIDSKVFITGSFVLDRKYWNKAHQDLLFIYDEDIAKAYEEERVKLFF